MFLFKDKLMSGEIPDKLRFWTKCVSASVSVVQKYEQENIASYVVGSKLTGVLV